MCSRTMLSATKTPVRPTPVLQCTVIGPSWPNCSFVLCTWLMKSMKASPELGTPCSGQSMKWNWRIVRDWPSYKDWEIRLSQYTLYRYVFHIISFNSLLFWTITHLNPPPPSFTTLKHSKCSLLILSSAFLRDLQSHEIDGIQILVWRYFIIV